MKSQAYVTKAIGALLSTFFALFLSARASVAQSLLPTEEEPIARIVSRVSNDDDDVRGDIRTLVKDFVAAGRLAAVEALFKKVISEVDRPDTYLRDYRPPMWPRPMRAAGYAIVTATLTVYPELISLLIEQGKQVEALEYTDMMRAKLLRAIIEKQSLGKRPFATFSAMSASHIKTLAKDTQSTFIVYALLPAPWRHAANDTW
jgi:hypothetical protein